MFSDLEILEIHQKTNKQYNNTVPDTSSDVKQKQSDRNKLPTLKNATLPNNAQPSNRSKQLQSHNLSTDDVKHIYSTNKGRYLLLANKPRIVP